MLALACCVLALLGCYLAGRRSLGWGLVALMTVGYFYGILRANLLTTSSYFTFDAGLIGLYLSQKLTTKDEGAAKAIRLWTLLLIGWPILLVFLPFQPLLISLVGLRGHVLFIPVLVLGARLKDKGVKELAAGLGALNLVAAGFATAEYYLGVPRFYPLSPVTAIIYASGDVAGGYFRIPSIFTSAHAYGGMMVATLPYLLALWEAAQSRLPRLLAVAGIGAALLGVLMSATRTNFVASAAIVLVTIFTNRMRGRSRFIFVMVIAAMGFVALRNERFQRFKSLGDTEYVAERIAGSVNKTFLEILTDYPMGNGLGGGGTSIPFFLQGQVRNPVSMENEYALILAEQGIIGLGLWLAFIGWFILKGPTAFEKGPLATSRRTAWCLAGFFLGMSTIGTGTFTSIPGTAMMLLGMGWTTTPRRRAGAWQRATVESRAPIARQPYPLAPSRFRTGRPHDAVL